jgi:uncharacterized protein with PIN domain
MTEKIRFYTDENVPNAVTRGLRLRGIDVLTTNEAGMLGASDEEHLALALQDGRVIFTQDADFLRLHAGGIDHAGIAYARQQLSIGDVIRGLVLIYQVLDADDIKITLSFCDA